GREREERDEPAATDRSGDAPGDAPGDAVESFDLEEHALLGRDELGAGCRKPVSLDDLVGQVLDAQQIAPPRAGLLPDGRRELHQHADLVGCTRHQELRLLATSRGARRLSSQTPFGELEIPGRSIRSFDVAAARTRPFEMSLKGSLADDQGSDRVAAVADE